MPSSRGGLRLNPGHPEPVDGGHGGGTGAWLSGAEEAERSSAQSLRRRLRRGARINVPVLPDLPEWEERHRLTLEKEVLGFYISGHPLHHYEEILNDYATLTGLTKENAVEGAPVRFGGMVTLVKVIRTKKGDQMAFISIEDLYSDIEVVVFPSTFADVRHILESDTIVMVEGVAQVGESHVRTVAPPPKVKERKKPAWMNRKKGNGGGGH